MAEVNFRDNLWMIRDHVPGVPEPMLYRMYAQTVKDFLRRAEAWRYTSPNLLDWASTDAFPDLTVAGALPTVVAGDVEVIIPDMVKWSDGLEIPFKTREQLDEIDPDWEALTGVKGMYWTITAPGTFYIYPQASSNLTGVIRLRTILTINIASRVSLPEEIMLEHENAFKIGTLSALYAIPGKDWSNIQLALAWGDQFETLIRNARSKADADYGKPERKMAYGGIPFSRSSSVGRVQRKSDYC